MPTYNFDDRYNVSGYRDAYSGGVLQSHTPFSALNGETGSNASDGNPLPYSIGVGGPWSLNKIRTDRGIHDGRVNVTGGYYIYSNCPTGGAPFSSATSVSFSDTSSASGLAADTNPSRPEVDLPVSIAELGDLPKLVWKTGSSLAKDLAKANLSVEFGLKPLISDVKNLLDFQGHADRRLSELSSLTKHGGSHHHRVICDRTFTDPAVNAGSLGVNHGTLWYQKGGMVRRWVCVRWVPDHDPRTSVPDKPSRAAAMRAVLGGTIDSSTVWNAMPWTWLIDWYADFGSYLAAKRNIVGYKVGQAYTMHHWETQTIHWRVGGQGSYTPPFFKRVSKSRSSNTLLSPSAQVPLMSARQLGILASLTVLKR